LKMVIPFLNIPPHPYQISSNLPHIQLSPLCFSAFTSIKPRLPSFFLFGERQPNVRNKRFHFQEISLFPSVFFLFCCCDPSLCFFFSYVSSPFNALIGQLIGLFFPLGPDSCWWGEGNHPQIMGGYWCLFG